MATMKMMRHDDEVIMTCNDFCCRRCWNSGVFVSNSGQTYKGGTRVKPMGLMQPVEQLNRTAAILQDDGCDVAHAPPLIMAWMMEKSLQPDVCLLAMLTNQRVTRRR